jgi:large subunit ribosomal protein L13
MKTFSAQNSDIERAWHVVDLEGATLGRAATEIATLLRGKHKPIFTPHVDCGDFVVIINCEKVEMTGNKWDTEMHRRYSGYPGGLSEATAREVLEKKPELIIESAVRGMLPKNRLGRKIIKKLKIYVGSEHPHEAQLPQPYELGK